MIRIIVIFVGSKTITTYTMKKTLFLIALICMAATPGANARKKPQVKQHTVVEVPKVQPQLIEIETENTQLLLKTTDKGQLQQLRYGRKLDTAPFKSSRKLAANVFPAAGGPAGGVCGAVRH